MTTPLAEPVSGTPEAAAEPTAANARVEAMPSVIREWGLALMGLAAGHAGSRAPSTAEGDAEERRKLLLRNAGE
jgi:hypothetical protein